MSASRPTGRVRDDLMRLGTENGPANMATIRHAGLNIIKQINDKACIKLRHRTLGWDHQYLLNAISRRSK
jgi:hypothetical protein